MATPAASAATATLVTIDLRLAPVQLLFLQLIHETLADMMIEGAAEPMVGRYRNSAAESVLAWHPNGKDRRFRAYPIACETLPSVIAAPTITEAAAAVASRLREKCREMCLPGMAPPVVVHTAAATEFQIHTCGLVPLPVEK